MVSFDYNFEMWEVYVGYPLFMAKISPAFNMNCGIFKKQRKETSRELENCPPLSFITPILYSNGVLAIDFWCFYECKIQYLSMSISIDLLKGGI